MEHLVLIAAIALVVAAGIWRAWRQGTEIISETDPGRAPKAPTGATIPEWRWLNAGAEKRQIWIASLLAREIGFDSATKAWREVIRGRGHYDYGVGAPAHECARHTSHCFCEGCVNEGPCQTGNCCTICVQREKFEPDRFGKEVSGQ